MINFIWKYKYILFSLLTCLFLIALINLNELNIFYDTERIIEMSNEDKDVIDKSIDDRNLLLISLEYKESLNYDQFLLIQNLLDSLVNYKNIKSIRSLYNEQLVLSSIAPIPFKLFDISSVDSYNRSINRINKFKSKFITTDFKKLLFVVKVKNIEDNDSKHNLLAYLNNIFQDLNPYDLNITGQIKSELYMQENITYELFVFTLICCILCSLILWYFVKNIFLVFINLISVFFSLIFTLSLSNILFGGIELVMIIVPAIIFIITISDFMHLLNHSGNTHNRYRFFRKQLQNIGKPVFITSSTTAIGFLSFTFSSVVPLMRFGFITTFSIFISLFIIVVIYAISVDKGFATNSFYNHIIDNAILKVVSINSKIRNIILLSILLISVFGISSIKIDNFITDEINKKSDLYVELSYFDRYFGGIKPVSFTITNIQEIDFETIKNFEEFITNKGMSIDFSSSIYSEYIIKARMKDIGSIKSSEILDHIDLYANEKKINIKIGGVGYLFDKLSNNMTKEILFGLGIAIIIVGLIFVFINNFNFYYFPISVIPNLIPLFACIGFMSLTNFYFSLSNAFIFAIAFGLIVDDSIHIINAYSINRSWGKSINESISYCQAVTFKAIIKTTVVIIVSLLPLFFSEFTSISQLAVIIFISAIVALIFDLIFLPILLRKYIS